jgi:hypothetical protein
MVYQLVCWHYTIRVIGQSFYCQVPGQRFLTTISLNQSSSFVGMYNIYNDGHVCLNWGLEEGDASSSSTWFNFGLWRNDGGNADTFASAASALAEELGNRLHLGDDDTVLDVGCGCGDQLVKWVRKYNVRSVVGINDNSRQVSLCQERITRENLETKCSILCTSAHQLDGLNLGFVNVVLALDSAYHFPSREEFFRHVFVR